MNLNPVVFDMDGVLFDSEPTHNQAWLDLLAPYGITFPMDWFKQWIGISDARLAEHLSAEGVVPLPAADLLARKRARYHDLAGSLLKPFPGVVDGLTQLNKAGVPLALCTSCTRPEAERSLECAGVRPLFSKIVSIDDVAHPKPSPDPYALAAQWMGHPASECFAVEDSFSGVTSACAAGLQVLGVANSFAPDATFLSKVNHLFPTTRAAIDWLLARYVH